MKVTRLWTVGGYRVIPADPGWDDSRDFNRLDCPRGSKPGKGVFLLSSADAYALSTAALTISCAHEEGSTTWTGYYLTGVEALSKRSNLVAVTVQDKRVLLDVATGTKRYNCRFEGGAGTMHFLSDTLNGSSLWTWQEILNDLWALLPSGIAGSAPTIGAYASTDPENLVFDGLSAWDCICRLLNTTGEVICYNPFTGGFYSASTTVFAWALDAVPGKLWDYIPSVATMSAAAPSGVGVTFHQIPGAASDNAPFLEVPETENYTCAGTGKELAIVDTLFAWDDNSATRGDKASDLAGAIDALYQPALFPRGRVWAGIKELLPGDGITNITWHADATMGTITRARHTDVECMLLELPAFLGAGGEGNAGCANDTIFFTITDAHEGDVYNYVDATVISRDCCTPGVELGDSVIVYDLMGCMFDEDPVADLVGRKGVAKYQEWQDAEPPYVVDVGDVTVGTDSALVNMPTYADYDILVLFVEVYEDDGITAPTGWTLASDCPVSVTGIGATRLGPGGVPLADDPYASVLYAFWRRASGTVSAPTITSTGADHIVTQCIAVRGAIRAGDPFDVTASSTDANSVLAGSIPGDTTTGDARLVLAAVATAADEDSAAFFSGWTNADLAAVTELIDQSTDTGLGGGIGVASGPMLVAGAFGATTVDFLSETPYAAWCGAIIPASCAFLVTDLCCPSG